MVFAVCVCVCIYDYLLDSFSITKVLFLEVRRPFGIPRPLRQPSTLEFSQFGP